MKVAEWKELRHDASDGKRLREDDPVSKTREGSLLSLSVHSCPGTDHSLLLHWAGHSSALPFLDFLAVALKFSDVIKYMYM